MTERVVRDLTGALLDARTSLLRAVLELDQLAGVARDLPELRTAENLTTRLVAQAEALAAAVAEIDDALSSELSVDTQPLLLDDRGNNVVTTRCTRLG